MGPVNSLLSRCSRRADLRLLTCGLDAAGKTSLLYRLALGQLLPVIPTIGFNVEEVDIETGIGRGSARATVWDIGGRDKMRALYRHYYPGTHGIAFVVDSNDEERLEQAAEELEVPLKDEELSGVPVAILCNKSDLAGAASPEKVQKLLEARLGGLLASRPFRSFATSACDGRGVGEAFAWLATKAATFSNGGKEASGGWCENWLLR